MKDTIPGFCSVRDTRSGFYSVRDTRSGFCSVRDTLPGFCSVRDTRSGFCSVRSVLPFSLLNDEYTDGGFTLSDEYTACLFVQYSVAYFYVYHKYIARSLAQGQIYRPVISSETNTQSGLYLRDKYTDRY